MVQAELVRQQIMAAFPEETVVIVPIETKGDREIDQPLTSFGGKGAFIQEIEEQLQKGTIDIAVHSAKDVPMELAEGLALGAVLEREDPGDVLVTCSGIPAAELPEGSVIGTGSLRREVQIKKINPGVEVRLLRGNVPTRLQKLRNGLYDGIILAAAGLHRLGLGEDDLSYEYLDPREFLPAAGQGILALEIRKGDLGPVMETLNRPEVELILQAEREFLLALGGSCNAPCGILCRKQSTGYTVAGMYAGENKAPRYLSMSTGEENPEELLSLIRRLACRLKAGRVSLVGAGAGGREMISLRGLECLKKAEVVVYDDLLAPSLLNEAPLEAQLCYVGKRAGSHAMGQEEINRLLVDKAREGYYVVRLKGGDPFVFGRGAEELLSMEEEGIAWEIVPGISSAYSIPALAGIPVTHRAMASSFHVITGHESPDKEGRRLDYDVLAREEGTLVFLMGLGHIGRIAGKLLAGGRPGDTPAAVISQGGTGREKVLIDTLAGMQERVRKDNPETPAIIVVGETVSVRERLQSSYLQGGEGQKLPLQGKRILLTGTRKGNRELVRQLQGLGGEAIEVSLIETRTYVNETEDEKLKLLLSQKYQWLVFVSAAGVEAFFQSLDRLKIDRRCLAQVRFAVVGKSTADVLAGYGYYCDFLPTEYCSQALAKEWIPSLEGAEQILLVRGRRGSEYLEQALEEAGIRRETACLYETIQDKRRSGEIQRLYQAMDYVILTSGSAGQAFAEMVKDMKAAEARLVSIGPHTTAVCTESGLIIDLEAREHTGQGICQMLVQDVTGQDEKKGGGRDENR